jgi:sugar O-acyltransferase (sialic acid O-acetyltransferase NeuD family)
VTRQIVVIGGGGLGRQLLDIAEDIPDIEVVGLLDDGEPDRALLSAYDVPLLGGTESFGRLHRDVRYVVGVADPRTKRSIENKLPPDRASTPLIHPSVVLARRVEVGPGSVLCACVLVSNHTTIRRNVLINSLSGIGHDVRLADFCTVSVSVVLSGGVEVEPDVFLGSGAVVNPMVRLGRGCVVGAGTVVGRDVPAGVTVLGVPPRRLGPDSESSR